LFNEVPELYDRIRPAYPGELFADLVAIPSGGGAQAALRKLAGQRPLEPGCGGCWPGSGRWCAGVGCRKRPVNRLAVAGVI